eukprot:TRINITY_DN13237_c7_g1_i1.p1 TRINITY_DN13237_c7_g1~~TRINITY_DN13237_c7_g1_i1.p1  ORF type:complete len:317 (+),score=26.22 TRINITY_DN13237_c7_g1_i1:45-953(+)
MAEISANLKLPEQLRQYEIIRKLGSGMYGSVLEVKKGNTLYALKILAGGEDRTQGVPYSSVREISFLSEIRSKNVVKMIESCFDEPFCYAVLEVASYDIVTGMPKTGYPASIVQNYMRQIMSGIRHCHAKQIVHRDLKPQNILLDSNKTIKICDFGMAQRESTPQKPTTREVVTVNYRAPELLLDSIGVTKTSIDIWSIGCIMAELCTGSLLFRGTTEVDIIIKMFSILGLPTEESWPECGSLEYFSSQPWPSFNPGLFYLDGLPAEGNEMLKELLVYDPIERATASEALRHDYFTVDCSNI